MMKKLFLFLTILLLLLVGCAYALMFTSPGNSIVASYVEDYVNTKDERINLKINDFSLSPKFIVLNATLDETSVISIEGDVKFLQKAYDLAYDINIKDLSKLEKFSSTKLKGSFKTDGKVVGDEKLLTIDGKSDVAKSKTTYHIELTDFNPSKIVATVKDARLNELLPLINQPNYSDGLLSIDANILSADINNLDGTVITTIKNGDLNEAVVNKEFNQNITKPINYDTKINSKLSKTFVNSTIDFNSNLANLDTNNTIYDLDKKSLISDYKLNISDLSDIEDFTKTKLRGGILIDGNVKYENDKPYIIGNSNLLGGSLNFIVDNDIVTSKIDGVKVQELLYMTYSPEVFDSSSNLDIKYNLTSKQGDMTGKLLQGHFLPSDFSNTIYNLANFDITKEVYENVDIASNINNQLIKSNVDMKSNLTHLKIQNCLIDLDKRLINALINTTIKELYFDTLIDGNLDNPTVKIDASQLLKSIANTELNKNGDKLQKKLEEKLGTEDAKKITDSLKSLFN